MTHFMHWFRRPTATKAPTLRVIDAMDSVEQAEESASVESAAHTVLCTKRSAVTITTAVGEKRGVLTPAMLRKAVASGQGHLPLSALLSGPTISVDANDDLATAASLFRRTGTHSAFVQRDGETIGILTRHSLTACVAHQRAA